jgi:hypothetical protein
VDALLPEDFAVPHPCYAHGCLLLAVLLALLAACGQNQPVAAPAPPPLVPTATALPEDLPPAAGIEPDAGDEPQLPATAGEGDFAPTGAIVADSGFRPTPDGFSFANYGSSYPSEPATFTVEGARFILGDEAVCAGFDADDVCVPSPLAAQWIAQMNSLLNGGRGEGFAALSQQIFLRQLAASDLEDGMQTPFDLPRDSREVAEYISAYAITQFLDPVAATTRARQGDTPAEILDALIATLAPNEDLPTLGIYQAGAGGHALVPFAVEDVGNGLFRVWVYDPNAPGAAGFVVIDRDTNTWTYAMARNGAGENRAVWGGDATTHTIDLTPAWTRELPLACPFCGTPSAYAAKGASGSRVVYSAGSSSPLITDGQGRRIGYDGEAFVNEIPGAASTIARSAMGGSQAIVFFLPVALDVTVTLVGTGSTSPTGNRLAVFAPGFGVTLREIELEAGQIETLTITEQNHVAYIPGGDQRPTFDLSVETPVGGYGFTLDGMQLVAGAAFALSAYPESGTLLVNGSGDLAYDLALTRTEGADVDRFTASGVPLPDGTTQALIFGAWNGTGDLAVETDRDGDDRADEREQLRDEDPTDNTAPDDATSGNSNEWELRSANDAHLREYGSGMRRIRINSRQFADHLPTVT